MIPRYQEPMGRIDGGEQPLFDPKKSKSNVTLFYPPTSSGQIKPTKRGACACWKGTALAIVALVAAGCLAFGVMGLSNAASYAARHLPEAALKHQATQWILQHLQIALNTVGHSGQIGFAAGGGGGLAAALVGTLAVNFCKAPAKDSSPKKAEVKGQKVKAEDLPYWTSLLATKTYLAIPREVTSTQTVYAKFVFKKAKNAWSQEAVEVLNRNQMLEDEWRSLEDDFSLNAKDSSLSVEDQKFLSSNLNVQKKTTPIASKMAELTQFQPLAGEKVKHQIYGKNDQTQTKKTFLLITTIKKPETRAYTYYKRPENGDLSIYTAALEEISRFNGELEKWTKIESTHDQDFFQSFPKQIKNSSPTYRVSKLENNLSVVAAQKGSIRKIHIAREGAELDDILKTYESWTKID